MSDNNAIASLLFRIIVKNKIMFYISTLIASIYFFYDKTLTTTVVVWIGCLSALCLIKECIQKIRKHNASQSKRQNKDNEFEIENGVNDIGKDNSTVSPEKEQFRKILPYKDWSYLPWGVRHIVQFITNMICLMALRFVAASKINGDYVSFFTTKLKLAMWFDFLTFIETIFTILIFGHLICQLLPQGQQLTCLSNIMLVFCAIWSFISSALSRAKGIEISKMEDRQMVFLYLSELKSSIANFIALLALIAAIIALPAML